MHTNKQTRRLYDGGYIGKWQGGRKQKPTNDLTPVTPAKYGGQRDQK